MATDSRVVALEGQLLRLRERERGLVESHEALLARQPSPQNEGMEELVRRYMEGGPPRTVGLECVW